MTRLVFTILFSLPLIPITAHSRDGRRGKIHSSIEIQQIRSQGLESADRYIETMPNSKNTARIKSVRNKLKMAKISSGYNLGCRLRDLLSGEKTAAYALPYRNRIHICMDLRPGDADTTRVIIHEATHLAGTQFPEYMLGRGYEERTDKLAHEISDFQPSAPVGRLSSYRVARASDYHPARAEPVSRASYSANELRTETERLQYPPHVSSPRRNRTEIAQ